MISHFLKIQFQVFLRPILCSAYGAALAYAMSHRLHGFKTCRLDDTETEKNLSYHQIASLLLNSYHSYKKPGLPYLMFPLALSWSTTISLFLGKCSMTWLHLICTRTCKFFVHLKLDLRFKSTWTPLYETMKWAVQFESHFHRIQHEAGLLLNFLFVKFKIHFKHYSAILL